MCRLQRLPDLLIDKVCCQLTAAGLADATEPHLEYVADVATQATQLKRILNSTNDVPARRLILPIR